LFDEKYPLCSCLHAYGCVCRLVWKLRWAWGPWRSTPASSHFPSTSSTSWPPSRPPSWPPPEREVTRMEQPGDGWCPVGVLNCFFDVGGTPCVVLRVAFIAPYCLWRALLLMGKIDLVYPRSLPSAANEQCHGSSRSWTIRLHESGARLACFGWMVMKIPTPSQNQQQVVVEWPEQWPR